MSPAARLLFTLALLAPAFAQNVPDALRPPDGTKLALQARGSGVQIYTCKPSVPGAPFAWVFTAPDADLLDAKGAVIGHHSAGPVWRLSDGSWVQGKVASSVPSPDAGSVPWLLLTAVDHGGSGRLARVLSIQRLNTNGGVAPKTPCSGSQAGQTARSPYTADYFFYAPGP
jgi:hypothetical protein